jgi:hypothetical protein
MPAPSTPGLLYVGTCESCRRHCSFLRRNAAGELWCPACTERGGRGEPDPGPAPLGCFFLLAIVAVLTWLTAR